MTHGVLRTVSQYLKHYVLKIVTLGYKLNKITVFSPIVVFKKLQLAGASKVDRRGAVRRLLFFTQAEMNSVTLLILTFQTHQLTSNE